MEQIKINDKIIEDYFTDSYLCEGNIKVKDFEGQAGDPICWFDENWKRYPDNYLYKNNLKEIPKGFIFDEKLDDIRAMTEVERIQAGIEKLPKGYKIFSNELVQKTIKEQYKDKNISVEDYSNYQRQIRNGYLMQTDKFMISDFPIDEKSKNKIKNYRQYLRDITQEKEFPDIDIKEPPFK